MATWYSWQKIFTEAVISPTLIDKYKI